MKLTRVAQEQAGDEELAALETLPRQRGSHSPGKLSDKLLVTTVVPQQKTGWTKARKDVLQVLGEAGYRTVELPMSRLSDWFRMAAKLHPGGHILLEYPFDQRKRAYLLALLGRVRRTKIYALIHDLDTIRFGTPLPRELAILKLFDGIISHNASMTRWLRDAGITRPIVELDLFDYCGAPGGTWNESSISSPLKVLCAGNLSFVKAGYIYDPRLADLPGVELSLYGAFFEPQHMRTFSSVRYKGVFDPDAPRLDGNYHFGLVWDGSSVETCDGHYGHYMRFNNPHKLSLYILLGLPVIVWKESAIAALVRERGIGVVVGDLRELGDIAAKVGTDEYLRMAKNVAALSQKVRRGEFLREALNRLLNPEAAALR